MTPRLKNILGALRICDPAAWARQVRRAMERADGRIPEAAVALGISWSTLYRWLDDPAFVGVERAPRGAPVRRKARRCDDG